MYAYPSSSLLFLSILRLHSPPGPYSLCQEFNYNTPDIHNYLQKKGFEYNKDHIHGVAFVVEASVRENLRYLDLFEERNSATVSSHELSWNGKTWLKVSLKGPQTCAIPRRSFAPPFFHVPLPVPLVAEKEKEIRAMVEEEGGTRGSLTDGIAVIPFLSLWLPVHTHTHTTTQKRVATPFYLVKRKTQLSL